ncbi:MAG: isochorismatase family protein [Phycisphaerales bacterium]
MPIPRLTPHNTALLVIDVQERLLPEIVNAPRLITRVEFLLRVAGHLGLPVAVTEQYVKGLGRSTTSIRDAAPSETLVVEKTRFSGCVDSIRDWLESAQRPNVLIAGVEAHVCVLQTALDLVWGGWRPFWVEDAISAGEADQIEPARRRAEHAGCTTTGCVSATYELLQDATHPAFKACLQEVKSIRGDGRS